MTAAEIKFVALVAITTILGLGIIFDPFDTVSYTYRTRSALVIGPMALGYGILGLVGGRFPEMIDADNDSFQWKFWFCSVTFIVMGAGLTVLGLDAFVEFGS